MLRANEAPKPSDEDDMKLPAKLREYLEINERIKQKKIDLKKSKGPKDKIKGKRHLERQAVKEALAVKPDETGADIPLRKAAKLERFDKESDLGYLNRIERVNLQLITL